MQIVAPTIVFLFALCSWEAQADGVTLEGMGKQVSPVQKVVQLIDKMVAKVQKATDEEVESFTEYAQRCEDLGVEKGHAIQDGKQAIEELDASIEDASDGIAVAASHIQDISTKISDTESELSTSLALRAKDRETFEKTESEMLETAGQFSEAAELVKKTSRQPNTTRPSLRRELLDDEDSLEVQPQTLDSNGVVDTLTDMTDKAEESLNELRKREADQQHSHALLKQGLENELNSLKEELAQATATKASKAGVLAAAKESLGLTTKAFTEDTAFLKAVKLDCMRRSRDFEITFRDNKAELKALEQAKAILQHKFALLQTGAAIQAHALARVHAHDDSDPKARALQSIERLGRKLHSTALVALAYRAASNPFDKVRSMVEDMIAKLMQEAADEATQKTFCDTEIRESNRSKDKKQARLDVVNARIEKAWATIWKLAQDVYALQQEIAESDADLAQAAAQRQKEKAVFLTISKDLTESEEACATAAQVLREYYEGVSLIQMGQSDASGILGKLEEAEHDFARNLAEAEAVEKASAANYEKLVDEEKQLKTTKLTEIKAKKSEFKSVITFRLHLWTDRGILNGDLDAVSAYLAKLKPHCEVQVPSYAERKAAREQEIEGLKDALKTLEA